MMVKRREDHISVRGECFREAKMYRTMNSLKNANFSISLPRYSFLAKPRKELGTNGRVLSPIMVSADQAGAKIGVSNHTIANFIRDHSGRTGREFCFAKILAFFLILFCSQIQCTTPFIYIPYHTSMQTPAYPDAHRISSRIIGIDGLALMKKFEELYEKNNPSRITPSKELKIPKIIHQVWLGSPVPDEFKAYMQSWKDHHPGWEYRLWTDKEVAQITLDNQKFYDESTNMGVKSDLLKWEIIYRYGGVYVDTDFECLQPLDTFHYIYDFYTGIQPLDTQFLQLGAALFGGVPGHPILKHCIDTIKDDWHKKGAPTKSGPVHFTKSFFAVAGLNGSIDIAMPAHYFYPLGCRQSALHKSTWIAYGAYAVHHWARSWMPAQYRLPQFKNINNPKSEVSWND